MSVALVGTGFIGPIHAEALRRLGKRVAGVLGSTPEKSAEAARRLGAERGYASFADLLADPAVASVHLTSPNRLHAEQAEAALRAGKAVVCEKPLAMNSAESRRLVALAAETGLPNATCNNVRFYPICHEMRERVLSGEIGEVRHVVGGYVQDWLLYDTDFNWRVLAEEGGSLRAVADIGTHWLDLARFVTGLEVVEVCADLATFLPTRYRSAGSVETFQGKLERSRASVPVAIDTEDYGSVLLRFEGGARGAMTVSQVNAGRKNRATLEVAGSKGALAWDSERPNELWLGRRDRPNELLLRDPALMSASARGVADTPGGHNEGFADTFKQLFRAFYAGAPAPTFADGHQEILLCEAIARSHATQSWTRTDTEKR